MDSPHLQNNDDFAVNLLRKRKRNEVLQVSAFSLQMCRLTFLASLLACRIRVQMCASQGEDEGRYRPGLMNWDALWDREIDVLVVTVGGEWPMGAVQACVQVSTPGLL